MNHKPSAVFLIREITTGKLIKFGTKCGWTSSMAAKNAFNFHMWGYFKLDFMGSRHGLFDRQSEFQLEEVK